MKPYQRLEGQKVGLRVFQTVPLFIYQGFQGNNNNNFVVRIGCFSVVVEDPIQLVILKTLKPILHVCYLVSHSPSCICEAKYFNPEAVYF